MKIRFHPSFLVLALLSTLTSQPATVLAQGTAFTYQGRLNAGSGAAAGIYDLRFTIYDSTNSPGVVVAGPVTNAATTVSNGLFTVTIDFGAAAFTGAGAWLEIGVRTNGNGTFNVLSPRQQITPAPYAITASSLAGVVANNTVNTAGGATVGGGTGNNANGLDSTVGGGVGNLSSQSGATVAGGLFNLATGGGATVAGGDSNHSMGGDASVGGGSYNQATGIFATVAGGTHNTSSGTGAFIGGGGDEGANVLGNTASGGAAVIGGGVANTSGNFYSTVGGGAFNTAGGVGSFVGGGGSDGTIFQGNQASGAASVVGGGLGNLCSGQESTIGGGTQNTNNGPFSTVGGGRFNLTLMDNSTIGGGYANSVNGSYCTVGGGDRNSAGVFLGGNSATVGGGDGNTASGIASTVSGGQMNIASQDRATVGGGVLNTASGVYATVPGGGGNTAQGFASLAAGHSAQALHDGTFVWADSSDSSAFSSSGPNQFLIRAAGGVGICTTNPQGSLHVYSSNNPAIVRIQSTGTPGFGRIEFVSNPQSDVNQWRPGYIQSLDAGGFTGGLGFYLNGTGSANKFATNEVMRLINGNVGIGTNNPTQKLVVAGNIVASGTITGGSDRNTKENFAPVNSREVLDKVTALPITRWNYRADAGVTHLGPMAQDFYVAFDVGMDDKHISMVDADGVALAAIQGLNEKLEETRAQNAQLKARLEKLERLLERKLNQTTDSAGR